MAGAVASSGVSPDAVRIGADCVQVWFLFKAARAEALAACEDGVNCFTGDTPVQTTGGAVAIDQLRVGERVLTQVDGPALPGDPPAATRDPNATAVDPATWREVDVTMPDSAHPGRRWRGRRPVGGPLALDPRPVRPTHAPDR